MVWLAVLGIPLMPSLSQVRVPPQVHRRCAWIHVHILGLGEHLEQREKSWFTDLFSLQ